jgi:sugar phosphate isomerase/epimerase
MQFLQEVGSEYLKISMDVAAFFLVDEEPADVVRTLMNDIRSVHLTDVKSAEGHAGALTTTTGKKLAPCALGEGIVPQREVLYTLKQIGYTGFLCILYQGDDEPAVGIERSTAYLKSIFREVRSA